MHLTDRVCVITGASSGIGRTTAMDLAADGARICAVARREERLQELLSALGGDARGHSYVVCDVSDRDQVRAMAGHVEATYGRCDVLINNAGYGGERGIFEASRGVENVEEVMATNFLGAVYCLGELLPLLERSAPSNVVNVASVAGRMAMPGASAYCASKFALTGWSEALHYELSDKGVYVSVVSPGFIPTEGFPQQDLARDKVLKHVLGTTSDVSRAIKDAIVNRKLERIVPRWYYALEIPRLLAPPLVRAVINKGVKKRSISRGRGEN
ncbi:MAG: SDR family oxidoreductase [Actinomycetota bacterium]|nr:SDR family oxidoreductase [Actinomycetota bacterium]